MNYDELFLIHGADYLTHVADKIELYSVVKSLSALIVPMPQDKQTAELQKYAAACEARGDEIFQEMGIPESYLLDGDLDALSDLMESELLSLDCGDCPGCCLCDEDRGYAGTCPTEDRDTAIRASMQEILEAVGEVLDAAEKVMRRIGDGN